MIMPYFRAKIFNKTSRLKIGNRLSAWWDLSITFYICHWHNHVTSVFGNINTNMLVNNSPGFSKPSIRIKVSLTFFVRAKMKKMISKAK